MCCRVEDFPSGCRASIRAGGTSTSDGVMPILESAGAALPGRPAVASLAPLGGGWAGTRGCLPNAPGGTQAGAVAVAILRWSQRLPAPRRAPAASNAARPRPDNSGGQRAGSHLTGSTSAHTAGRRAYLKIDPRGATTASPPFAEQVSVSGGQAARGTARHGRTGPTTVGPTRAVSDFSRRGKTLHGDAELWERGRKAASNFGSVLGFRRPCQGRAAEPARARRPRASAGNNTWSVSNFKGRTQTQTVVLSTCTQRQQQPIIYLSEFLPSSGGGQINIFFAAPRSALKSVD